MQSWDGKTRGSASYYRMTIGAEVIALSGMGFSWALDDFAARQNGVGDTTSPCGQRMVQNILDRWTSGAVAPAPTFSDGGVDDDGGPDIISDGGTDNPLPPTDASVPTDDGGTNAASGDAASSCSCRAPGRGVIGTAAAASTASFVALAVLRIRRRRRER